jgi:hypothetical protein
MHAVYLNAKEPKHAKCPISDFGFTKCMYMSGAAISDLILKTINGAEIW